MFVLFGSLKWQRMIFFLFDERLEGYLSNVTLNVALFKLLYCVCSVVIRGRIHSFHGQLVWRGPYWDFVAPRRDRHRVKFLGHTTLEITCRLSCVRVSICNLFHSLLVMRLLIIKVSENLVELGLHFLNVGILFFFLLIIFFVSIFFLHSFHLLNSGHVLLSKLCYQLLTLSKPFFFALLMQKLSDILELMWLLGKLSDLLAWQRLFQEVALYNTWSRQMKGNILLQIWIKPVCQYACCWSESVGLNFG